MKQTLDTRAVGEPKIQNSNRILCSIWPNGVHKARVLSQLLVATPKYLWVWLLRILVHIILLGVYYPFTYCYKCIAHVHIDQSLQYRWNSVYSLFIKNLWPRTQNQSHNVHINWNLQIHYNLKDLNFAQKQLHISIRWSFICTVHVSSMFMYVVADRLVGDWV